MCTVMAMHSVIQGTLGNVHHAYMNSEPVRQTAAPIAVYSRASGPLVGWYFLMMSAMIEFSGDE